MKKYHIIAVTQVYNELEKENLERFFTYLKPLVDEIVIYDDCSTDGSYEYALTQTPYVIRGTRNDFADEINHRQQMLEAALKLKPDFVLWLDADEVLTRGANAKLQQLCDECKRRRLDGISLHEWNLWRSATWRRLDSSYDLGWFTRLWRVKPGMGYGEIKKGLHQSLVPPTVEKVERSNKLAVLHYGFSTKKNLAYKYLTYRSHGQRGYDLLDRLISEEQLELAPVSKSEFPEGLWVEEEKPKPLPYTESLAYVEAFRDQVFRPKYSIACLIYKSIDWLEFARRQVLKYTDLADVEFFFVANDADEAVLKYLRDNYIPHYQFNNTAQHKKEWYINNVYRAYNFAAQKAKGDFLVFINSDMAFTPGWLDALIAAYNGHNLVASRLVESGKLKTGAHGIEKDFGQTIADYREAEFQKYAESIREKTVSNSGLFMPLLVSKRHFNQVGGYPEGNIKIGSDIFKPKIAKPNDPQISGDNILMQRMATIGVTHQTAMDSVAYHFQCGEKDNSQSKELVRKEIEIAVVNDLATGTMGERVLWNYLIDSLPGAYGLDTRLVGKSGFESKAKSYIDAQHPNTALIIQNATFIGTIDASRPTIAFLQDDLRRMGKESSQQEANLRLAETLVTNSVQTALSYPEYDFDIIPVGLDSDLFKPRNQASVRKKYGFDKGRVGIFVGSFSEVKGWSKIKECINKYPDITWIVVSKYNETYKAPNVRAFSRINQEKLSDLLNCADFFIIGSPVETQCLAAVEANLCNIPVVMPLVGIYRDFTPEERATVGIFDDNLVAGVKEVFAQTFSPRETIMNRGFTVHSSMAKWQKLLERVVTTIDANTLRIASKSKRNQLTFYKYRAEYLIRKKVFRPIFNNEYPDPRMLLQPKELTYRILIRFRLLNTVKRIIGRK